MIADINAGGFSGRSSEKTAALPPRVEAQLYELAPAADRHQRARMVAVAFVVCPELFTGQAAGRVARSCGVGLATFRRFCSTARAILAKNGGTPA